jgi:hypothetical protein
MDAGRALMRQGCREVRYRGHLASSSPPRSPHLGQDQGADHPENPHDEDKPEEFAPSSRACQQGKDQAANDSRNDSCDDLLLKVHQPASPIDAQLTVNMCRGQASRSFAPALQRAVSL